MQVQKKYHHIAYLLLLMGLWAFFAFALPEVLTFWEKNQLFRFTSEYWHFFDHEPFGRLLYLHTFLIQFNYYPWLGAIIHALLFSLTAFLLNRCLGTKECKVMLPGFVFAALLLPSVVNFELLFPLVAILALGGALFWLRLKNHVFKYGSQVIILAILTFWLHEYVIWACLLYIALDFRHIRQRGEAFRLVFLLPALYGTAISFGIGTILFQPYDFISYNSLLKFAGNAFSPSAGIPYAYFKPGLTVYICLGSAAIFSWLSSFHIPSKTRSFAWIASWLAMTGCAFITKRQAEFIESFQKVDKLCREYRWHDALRTIDSEWDKRWNASNKKTQRLFYGQTKLALLASRQATNRLFTYPQPVFPMLFPLDMANQPENIILPTYYTFAGGFSESLHLSYDLVTCHAISANVLSSVIINSLIVNDTIPAYKLTYLLEKSLFYRKHATIYKNPTLRENLPEIQRGKRMLPSHNFGVGGYKPDMNSMARHFNQPENPYFYEYYLSVCLLYKLHQHIASELPTIKRFYQKGGLFLAPRHIQEAILANFDYAPLRYNYPRNIEGISQETWNDYWRFISDNQSYSNGNTPFTQLQRKWGHTYWFYDCYLKPVALNPSSSQSVN